MLPHIEGSAQDRRRRALETMRCKHVTATMLLGGSTARGRRADRPCGRRACFSSVTGLIEEMQLCGSRSGIAQRRSRMASWMLAGAAARSCRHGAASRWYTPRHEGRAEDRHDSSHAVEIKREQLKMPGRRGTTPRRPEGRLG